jgi:hypothetical protein
MVFVSKNVDNFLAELGTETVCAPVIGKTTRALHVQPARRAAPRGRTIFCNLETARNALDTDKVLMRT